MFVRKDTLKLVPPSDPILKGKPLEYDFEKHGSSAEMFANVLFEKMEEYGGIGLSANQLGLNVRVFVIGSGENRIPFFNPEIITTSEQQEKYEEGCLSFPGVKLQLSRPSEVTITFLNAKGQRFTETFKGLTARIILHEYDHMQGLTMRDHVSKLKWDLALKKKKRYNDKLAKYEKIVAKTQQTSVV